MVRKEQGMKRFCAMVGIVMCVLGSLAAGARADSWIGHSLELNVSDAEVVVRGTVGEIATLQEAQGLTDGYVTKTVTLKIREVLKSPPALAKAEALTVLLPYDDERYVDGWQKEGTELLVCLVKAERYRMMGDTKPLAATWAVRHGRAGETGAIPLGGDAGRRAPTLEMKFLKKGEEIRKVAAEVIKEDTDHVPARGADGSVKSMEIVVPLTSEMDRELHSRAVNTLVIPLTQRAAAAARQWVKAEDPWSRGNAVRVLGEFKSDEHVGLLKSLLKDPEAQYRTGGGDTTIVTYPIRAAAREALKAWGIEAEAVVEETVRQEK
jgi:hypothetical protein